MRITSYLSEASIIPALESATVEGVLKELAFALVKGLPSRSQDEISRVLYEREVAAPTAMEKGVAIPHGRLGGIPDIVGAFGVSRPGVNFQARDGGLSHFFFALVAPEQSAGVHLKALAKVSRIFRSDALRKAILGATTAQEVYALLAEEDERALGT